MRSGTDHRLLLVAVLVLLSACIDTSRDSGTPTVTDAGPTADNAEPADVPASATGSITGIVSADKGRCDPADNCTGTVHIFVFDQNPVQAMLQGTFGLPAGYTNMPGADLNGGKTYEYTIANLATGKDWWYAAMLDNDGNAGGSFTPDKGDLIAYSGSPFQVDGIEPTVQDIVFVITYSF